MHVFEYKGNTGQIVNYDIFQIIDSGCCINYNFEILFEDLDLDVDLIPTFPVISLTK